METDQEILGEIRKLRRDYDEISVALRGDSYWLRMRSQIDHGMTTLQAIPSGARWCIFGAVCCLGYAALYRNGKVAAIGLDLLFLSLLFVGAKS